MKRILKSILCLSLVLCLCFGLTACDNEFNGNFKTVATADEINETFAKVNANEVETTEVTGYRMQMTVKGNYRYESLGEGAIDMSMDAKVSAKDDLKLDLAMTIKFNTKITTGGFEQKSAVDMSTYAYFDNDAMYTKLVNNLEENAEKKEYKLKIPMPNSDLNDLLDDSIQYGNEFLPSKEFMAMTTAELESSGIKVYIDSNSNGIKIKFEFDDTKNGEDSVFGKGSAIYSYDASTKLRGLRMNFEREGMSVFYEMKPYNGSIKLPTDLDTYGVLNEIF